MSCIVFLSGCKSTSVLSDTRVSSNVSASEFNSISSRYMERPTFISTKQYADGSRSLHINTDTYGRSESYIWLKETYIDEHIAMIEKYLEWEALASRDGDMFTKVIGKPIGSDNIVTHYLRYRFHSGNESNHMLMLAFCSSMICLEDDEIAFDQVNAKRLKSLYVSFKKNAFTTKDKLKTKYQ